IWLFGCQTIKKRALPSKTSSTSMDRRASTAPTARRIGIALTVRGKSLPHSVRITGQSSGFSYFHWPDRMMMLGFGMRIPQKTDGLQFGGMFAKFDAHSGTIVIPEEGSVVIRLIGVPSVTGNGAPQTYTFESAKGTSV